MVKCLLIEHYGLVNSSYCAVILKVEIALSSPGWYHLDNITLGSESVMILIIHFIAYFGTI